VLTVENISKRYLVGHQSPGSDQESFRDAIVRQSKKVVRTARDVLKGRQIIYGDTIEEFWALNDICFELDQGEVLGVIGRNGAGKSTLLKVLSRITEPTSGRVVLQGRVSSLLEVGTGFHPELTGRENIFLNGAILGMARAEIKAKFDEIVAFAGVERFIDTPVKRYSSGMYVRLAFAVAAHLEPEILIVDEVLAVGDSEFQKRCLGKMHDVARDGRTVIFVSHNLATIEDLCTKGILLENGCVKVIDSPANAVAAYQASVMRDKTRNQVGEVIKSVNLSSETFYFGDEFEMAIDLLVPEELVVGVNVEILNERLEQVFLMSTNPHDGVDLPVGKKVRLRLSIPDFMVAPGSYHVSVSATEPAIRHIERLDCAAGFEVLPKRIKGQWPYERRFGQVFLPHLWEVG